MAFPKADQPPKRLDMSPTFRPVNRKYTFFVIGAFAMLLCVASGSHAQSDVVPQRGFHPTASYAISDIETVNTTNGNLMLDIPLAALPPGRGGNPGFQLRLRYNSKLWHGVPDTADVPDRPGQTMAVTWLQGSEEGGWRYNLKNYSLVVENRNSHGVFYTAPDPRHYHIWKLKLVSPDGGMKELRPHGHDDATGDGYYRVPPSPGMSYYSTDGSFLRLDYGQSTGEWTLSVPDGARVVGDGEGQRRYDRNGNYTQISSIENYENTGRKADRVVDQLSRSITVVYGADEDYIHATGVGGVPVTTTVKRGATYVTKTYRAGGHFQYDTNWTDEPVRTVKEIVLPSQLGNLKYTFAYNGHSTKGAGTTSVGWGELNSITLPSGAKADYQYFMDNKSGSGIRWDWIVDNSPTKKDLNYTLEYDGVSSPAGTETWLYSINASRGQITSPDGGVSTDWFYSTATTAWNSGMVYKSVRPDGSVTERRWEQNRPYLPDGLTLNANVGVNPYVRSEFTSIADKEGTPVKTAIKDYSYDKNGNVTRVKEYDWVEYGSVHDAAGNPLWDVPRPAIIREMVNTYYSETPDAGDSLTFDPDTYNRPGAPLLRTAISSSEEGDGTQTLSRSEFQYDDFAGRGNLTEQRSWDSTKGGTHHPLTRPLGLGGADNYVSVSHEYDGNATDPALRHGNLTATTDARRVRTEYDHGSVGGHEGLYTTEVRAGDNHPSLRRTTRTEYDFSTGLATKVTDADNGVSTVTQYDALGRPTLVRAAADTPSVTRARTIYMDAERQVITRSNLDSKDDARLVSVTHYDQLGRVRLARGLEDSSAQISDHPTAAETDERVGIKVQTRYRHGGQNSYRLVSNPYRAAKSADAGGEETMGWSWTAADRGCRVVEAESFSGSGLPAPFNVPPALPNAATTGAVTTLYDAELTTVKDQAGKSRRSVADGLGRLAKVVEDPDDKAHVTNYTYDALGNLTRLTQGGQVRTYEYSSLSRLTSATNPEACRQEQSQCVPVPVTYDYDANGNLRHKTDARGVVTTYGYDELNRVTSRSYSDGTPAVAYYYDSQWPAATGAPAVATFDRGLSKGHLIAVTYGGGAEGTYYGGYDALGRVTRSLQRTGEQNYLFPSYAYNRAGNLKSQTYPSGRVVETEYDAAGRIAGVRNGAAGPFYAGGAGDADNRIAYAAHGAVSAMRLANNDGLWEHTSYNSRLQPTHIGLGTSITDSSKLSIGYKYGVVESGALNAAKNNGNVQGQTITVPAAGGIAEQTVRQTYTYDELNRLWTARETNESTPCPVTTDQTHDCWRQVYSYDRFGNRTFGAGTTMPAVTQGQEDALWNPSVSGANNRIISAGYGYDDAGNLKIRPDVRGSFAYFYDAENRMVKADETGLISRNTGYFYDGEGRRVKKVTGTDRVTTVFVYDAFGKLAAEYSGVATQGSGTHYLTQDHLGSTRAVTSPTGEVKARHDYFPFGEEIGASVGGRTTAQGYSQPDGVRQKFTGQERDDETGLDFMQSRYYSSTQGRFTSPDVFWKDSQVSDPQSWNKYAYVRNNPLKYVDPTGEKATVKIETDEEKKKGKITVTATIALWTSSKSGLSQKDLQKAAQEYKSNMEKAWSGTYEQNGIKYEVSVTVDVQAFESRDAANNSFDGNVQNVLEVKGAGGHSFIRPASVLGGPDRGEIAFDAGIRKSEAAHEFTHILGVDDRYKGAYLSNTFGAQRAQSATAYDYGWAFGGAINDHRSESRPHITGGRQLETLNAGPGGRRGEPRSHTSTRELGAPALKWWR